MEPWPALAAANNADWCDIVCRTKGITTATRDGSAWTSRIRTPPVYPDAVTLVAQQPASELLSRIDDSPGCSIKDSFATLDLNRHGFRVIVDAQWIVHSPYVVDPFRLDPRWMVVRELDAFTLWEQAWRGADGPAHVLRPDLLRCQGVAVLAAQVDDRIVGGAVLTDSSTVVGISNVFSEEPLGSEIGGAA